MKMHKTSILVAALSSSFLAVSAAMADSTVIASAKSGTTIPGNDASNSPVVSADGRYVAFETSATNLGVSYNGKQQILRKDLSTGAVSVVSVSSSEVLGDSYSFAASISDNGQRVAFSTYAQNFSSTANNNSMIAVRDYTSGTTQVVSLNTAGVAANGNSSNASISGNGRYVVFSSYASDLIGGDSNGKADIFLRDLSTGAIERISVNSTEQQSIGGDSVTPVISADGRYVAFTSYASNLVSGDNNGQADIFVRDRQLGTTYLVSKNSNGVIGDRKSSIPHISDDGRYIVFHSFSSNLDTAFTTFSYNIFLRDMQTGKTSLISRTPGGVKGDSFSYYPNISGNGRFISFVSRATNLVSSDGNGAYDLFVYDRAADRMTIASNNNAGDQLNGSISTIHDFSADGSTIVFASSAASLSSNGKINIFANKRTINQAPVANAGSYAAVECTGTSTPVMLNGSLSSDPEGSSLSYAWTTPVGAASGMKPYVSLNVGDNQNVSLIVKDTYGLSSTAANAKVSVVDTGSPTVSFNVTDQSHLLLADTYVLEADSRTGADFTVPYAANDTCSTSLTINSVESANVTTSGHYPFVIGSNGTSSTMTVTARDAKGNAGSKTATIIVNDTTAPVFTSAPATVVAEATATQTPAANVALSAPTASDIFDVTVSNNAPASYALGDHTITWTAVDENGNSNAIDSVVSIKDTTAPTFTSTVTDVTKEATGPMTDITLTAPGTNDLFPGSLDYAPKGPYEVGSHSVTWTAMDTSGNSATTTQLVNINDTTAPALTIPANYIMEANGNPSHIGSLGMAPRAMDLVDLDVTANIVVTEPTAYQLGANNVVYSVADSRNNSVSKTQTITVQDTTKPVFNTVPADVSVEATAPITVVTLGTPDVFDHYMDNISSDAPVDAKYAVGENNVTWSAVDTSGNTATAVTKVTVTDTTAPALTVPAGFTMEANGKPSLVSSLGGTATANDLVDLDLSSKVVVETPANGYQLGNNTVVYSVSDSRGNTATQTQVVNIVDTTEPVFQTVLPSVTREATGVSTTVNLPTPEVFDHYLDTITHNPTSGFDFPMGDTQVVWKAMDTSGNFATQIQMVKIVDTTPPALTVPASITVEANGNPSNGYALGAATAIDLVDGNVSANIVIEKPAAGYQLGTNLVSYSVTDNAGNTATATQTVTVVDTTAPVLNTPLPAAVIDVIATGELTTVNLGNVTATDLYLDSVSNDRASNQFPVGKTVVTWTAKDTSGNTTQYQQTVRVSYQFNGFKAPLNDGGIYKAGRTLPVQINLSYANGTPVETATPTIAVFTTSNVEVDGTALDISSSSAADAGTTLRALNNGDYIYNLDTSSMGKGTFQMAITPDQSGVKHVINIALK